MNEKILLIAAVIFAAFVILRALVVKLYRSKRTEEEIKNDCANWEGHWSLRDGVRHTWDGRWKLFLKRNDGDVHEIDIDFSPKHLDVKNGKIPSLKKGQSILLTSQKGPLPGTLPGKHCTYTRITPL